MAFKDYSIRKGVFRSPWAGLKYFKQLFNTPIFPQILKNTIILSLESLVIGFPVPIILALAFNELSSERVKKALQTFTFAPYFISTVVVVSIMTQVFSYRYGVVNSFLNHLVWNPLILWGQNPFSGRHIFFRESGRAQALILSFISRLCPRWIPHYMKRRPWTGQTGGRRL